MTDAASLRVAPKTFGYSRPRALPDFARGPAYGAMFALAVVLSVFSNGYGYHRDELYFRMLKPGWGYIDEPPLTPLLARLFSHFSDQPWALRVPATLATLLSVYVLALVTREFGGGRRAQALCAWAYSFAAIPLVMGHVLLTSTIDLPVWPAVVLFIARAQLRRQPAWWLAAGAVVGVSMYNKLLVAVLLLALLVGAMLVGRAGRSSHAGCSAPRCSPWRWARRISYTRRRITGRSFRWAARWPTTTQARSTS